MGKGCGNRMYKHENDVKHEKIPNKTNYDLYYKIKQILQSGGCVQYETLGENLEELEALSLESAFIDFYGIDNLCNYLKSWSGSMHRSEKTKRKQSLALKGSKSYMFGKPKTEDQKLKNSLAHRGINNSRYNKTTYTFFNFKTNTKENCTQFELRNKYNLDSSGLYYMIKGKRKSIKGWTLGISLDDIEKLRRIKISNSSRGRPKSDKHRKTCG